MAKHVTYAEKSLLMDDEAADLLTRYSAELANRNRADTVTLRALSDDGNEIEATFVLDAGTNLMAETTHSSVNPPDDEANINDLREKVAAIEASDLALPFTTEEVADAERESRDL
jgi:hypothetical protein